MSESTPTISIEFAGLLEDWLEQRALHSPDLRDPLRKRGASGRIELQAWQGLLAQAQTLLPSEAVGLEIGAGIRAHHVGTLGYLVVNCETLAEALETYVHCEHQFYGVNFARLNRVCDHWRLSWARAGNEEFALVVEVAFAALFTFMRQRFGGFCRLRSVDLPGRAPADLIAYERFFGCPVRFGGTEPGLDFELQDGQQKIPMSDIGDFAILREQQNQAFNDVIPVDGEFLYQLRHLSLRLLPYGEVSLRRVSEEMHMSPRTCQRRLSRYQMQYQELLDGLREQLAKRYLIRSELSLAQLTQLLGFSEQSAFQRAFKQWANVTPGCYRKAHRIQGQ